MSRSDVLSTFSIGSDTLSRWVRQYKETGGLSAKHRGRYKTRKLDDEALINYINAHSDATLQEIADEFSVCFQSVWKRLKVLNITRKKNHVVSREGRRVKGRVSIKDPSS